MMKIIILAITVFIHGCTSEESLDSSFVSSIENNKNLVSVSEVNLLGTWNYDISTKNTVCDNFVAKGIITYSSLNGDITKMGNETLQGEGFGVDDYGDCLFVTIDETNNNWKERSSTLTPEQFEKFNEQDSVNEFITNYIVVDTFTDSKIIYIINYSNGTSVTTVLTR